MHEAIKKEREKYQEGQGPDAGKRPSPIRAKLRQQAEELLAKTLTLTEVEKEIKA